MRPYSCPLILRLPTCHSFIGKCKFLLSSQKAAISILQRRWAQCTFENPVIKLCSPLPACRRISRLSDKAGRTIPHTETTATLIVHLHALRHRIHSTSFVNPPLSGLFLQGTTTKLSVQEITRLSPVRRRRSPSLPFRRA